jgi:hypothetical protein
LGFPGEDPALPEGQAYRFSLVDTESCPLPKGVDPDKTTIVSYKVRLESADEHGVPVNYFYASLLSTDGSRYLASQEGCAPLLAGTPLRKGQASEGYLNFPLPRAKTPETLVYSPELFDQSGEEAYQELSLRQKEDSQPSSSETDP